MAKIKRGSDDGPRHYSFSQCKTFSMCPMKWWYQKVEGKKQRPSYAMLSGTAAHGALETHNLMKVDGQRGLTAEEVVEAAVETMRGNDQFGEIELSKGKAIDTLEQEFTGPAFHYLTQTERKVWRDADPATAKVEHEILLEVCGLPFVGYLDLWIPGHGVIDYKFSARKKSDAQVHADPQQRLYSFATKEPAGFLQLLRGRQQTVLAVQKPDPRQEAGAVAWATSCIEAMEACRESGVPPHRCDPTNWWCGKSCEFFDECFPQT